jgi:hypothetical protein
LEHAKAQEMVRVKVLATALAPAKALASASV